MLNAVRWALYGHYSDRQGRPVTPTVMLNRAARREGERRFSVELHLQDGPDTYLIRRTQKLYDTGAPASEQYIERNSSPLSAADRRRAVDHLLNEDIARFFLFDGEQLQQYESLLFSNDTGSRIIKESIEQILGLPVLEQTMADLEAVKDEFDRRIARQARRDDQLQQYALRAEQLQTDLESKRQDLEELKAKRAEQESIISDRDAILQQFENSAAAIAELDSFAQRARDLQRRRVQLGDLRAASLQMAWRDMLVSVVAPIRTQMQTAHAQQQELLRDQFRQDLLRESINRHQCAVCERPLDADHQHMLEAGLSQTTSRADDTPDPGDFALLTQLASLTDTGQLSSAIGLDEQLADLESEEIVLHQEESRLRAALQDLPTGELQTAAHERDRAQEEIGRLSERIDDAEAGLSDINSKLREARSRLSGSESVEPYLVHSANLAANLQSVFEAAKSQFRDELRSSVEATASEVFKELTTEPAYSGLSITDNYGLEILDDDGEVVTGRSAGQEQVVALALIAALNRNATRRAAVIMDTPFGRLDPDHRAHVLRYASRLAEQVFLLVHGGEVTSDDLRSISDQITDQYELQYDDPDRTTLAVRSTL